MDGVGSDQRKKYRIESYDKSRAFLSICLALTAGLLHLLLVDLQRFTDANRYQDPAKPVRGGKVDVVSKQGNSLCPWQRLSGNYHDCSINRPRFAAAQAEDQRKLNKLKTVS